MRALRRIQKIIQVTNPTAMIDSEPPRASWASNVRACWVRVRPRVTPTLTSTAIATPSQTLGSSERRFVRTRKATRMLTTSDASSPSRSPMRALPSMLDPVVGEPNQNSGEATFRQAGSEGCSDSHPRADRPGSRIVGVVPKQVE